MRVKKPTGHHETFFKFPVLSDYTVVIIFTDDIPASARYVSDRDNFNLLGHEKLDTALACHACPFERGHSYLFFNTKAYAGSIAHECWHMIYSLMEFTGIRLEDEFIAYHLGYAVQQVVQFQWQVQGRTKNDSRGSRSKAGAGRVGRSDRNRSKSQTQRSFGVYGTSKVRGSKTRSR